VTSATIRLLGAVLLATRAAPLHAQTAFTAGPAYGASVYAGYMQLDNLFRATGGATFTNGNAAQIGAQAGVSLGRVVGVLGSVTYVKTPTRFELGAANAAGAPVLASPDLKLWLLDGNLQFHIPLGYTITPFVQAGIGAARYSMRVNEATHGSTSVAYNVGIGADVPLFPHVGLVVLAKDYIVALEWDRVGDPRWDEHITKSTTTNIGVGVGLQVGY
jgi:hypothetical protein